MVRFRQDTANCPPAAKPDSTGVGPRLAPRALRWRRRVRVRGGPRPSDGALTLIADRHSRRFLQIHPWPPPVARRRDGMRPSGARSLGRLPAARMQAHVPRHAVQKLRRKELVREPRSLSYAVEGRTGRIVRTPPEQRPVDGLRRLL